MDDHALQLLLVQLGLQVLLGVPMHFLVTVQPTSTHSSKQLQKQWER